MDTLLELCQEPDSSSHGSGGPAQVGGPGGRSAGGHGLVGVASTQVEAGQQTVGPGLESGSEHRSMWSELQGSFTDESGPHTMNAHLAHVLVLLVVVGAGDGPRHHDIWSDTKTTDSGHWIHAVKSISGLIERRLIAAMSTPRGH